MGQGHNISFQTTGRQLLSKKILTHSRQSLYLGFAQDRAVSQNVLYVNFTLSVAQLRSLNNYLNEPPSIRFLIFPNYYFTVLFHESLRIAIAAYYYFRN
jgi:hypothetical protein